MIGTYLIIIVYRFFFFQNKFYEISLILTTINVKKIFCKIKFFYMIKINLNSKLINK